ncbi:MAG: DUF4397 domain-containing protein [Bacteroidetes bacterium]|nr:MAG: DUF4397 domain-containing protein [Bacteroidota bacterium]REK05695.1 MAG: DUF4397 domain-containing protein [Bacteroidota bacterium]REK31999.1 MAG: DUF4397 domain-containing protein [Bacteroidota bacterium]REK50063.1 MAG: DUF4397 domain-containing protein [Bacteroidota bacterium]
MLYTHPNQLNSLICNTMKKSKLLTLLMLGVAIFTINTLKAQTADLQVIHNAADPAASSVDIYVNGTLTLDDFAFRSATSFLTLPSGVPIDIGVAPSSSTSVSDTIKNFNVTLMDGNRYVAVANGVLNPASFAANPDGRMTDFNLFIQDNIRAASVMPGEVDFIVLHGATDAPTVDVLARNVAPLVDNAVYGDITPYISVPAASYLLDITPGNNNNQILLSYTADLSALAGGTAVVMASGFLDPSMNQNGPAFGLWAFLSDGTPIQLPQTSQARLQIIHNAADPAASAVDVYVNGTLELDDFAFRTATPYIDMPADVMLNIGVAPSSSTSVNDTLRNFEVMLQNGETYAAIANGVINPASFAPNPDAIPTDFTLFLQSGMREVAMNAGEVDLRVVHGSSDAPTVDVLANSAIIVDDAAYSAITGYLSVPPSVYLLDITPGNNNSIIVASFTADISTLAGQSVNILASGFLDPSMNQNGPAFTLIAVLADGTVINLSNVTGIEEGIKETGYVIFPNPSRDFITISNERGFERGEELIIYNSAGQEKSIVNTSAVQDKVLVDLSTFEPGIYLVRSSTEGITQRFIKQ